MNYAVLISPVFSPLTGENDITSNFPQSFYLWHCCRLHNWPFAQVQLQIAIVEQ